jgi:ABC-2 type transport system ATP-binding protein
MEATLAVRMCRCHPTSDCDSARRAVPRETREWQKGATMLVVDRLRKQYGSLVAVNDISFSLNQGDIFGFIGPNGAGKTTTIRILATLHAATSGAAYVDGMNVDTYPDEVRSLIGYMPDSFGVYDDVRTWEYLDFFAAAYRIPRTQRAQIINDVLELTDLSVKKESYVRELSRGMKQRLCLAKTLVHDPKLLILDEPASGLDPRARFELKELLKELRNMGKTILISSHILPELSDFCNKIGVIEKGSMVLFGAVEEILAQLNGGSQLEIRLALGDDYARALDYLLAMAGVERVECHERQLLITFNATIVAQYQLIAALVNGGFRVETCAECRMNLEDVFMAVTKGAVQ